MGTQNYIKEMNYGNVTVVENRDYQWAVIDSQGNFVVPFGKYGWIDGFDSGLARVRTNKSLGRAVNIKTIILGIGTSNPRAIEGRENIQKYFDYDKVNNPEKYAKWGIINEKGEEVLPVIYDEVWNFFGKNRYSTKVEKDGVESDVYFHDLNPSLPVRGVGRRYNDYEDEYEYNPMYDYDESDTWYAMTDGMYGDMPDGFDGDYSFMGY